MSDYFDPHWLFLAIVPLLVLISLALNYKRARRWEQKIRTQGHVHCAACGYVGNLLVRTISAGDASSSNLRLVCGECDSSDWHIPEDQKAP
jgi:hypothetical protein